MMKMNEHWTENIKYMIVHIVIIAHLTPLLFASDVDDDTNYNCTETKNPYQANCTNLKELPHVPQYFNPGLQILDVSQTRLQRIREDEFARYPKLETLIIRDNHIQTISDKTLSSHTNLIHVDFSFISLQNLPQLPSSVEWLDLSGNSVLLENAKTIEFPKLKSLKTLSLRSNHLKTFPNLNFNGDSLEEVDLRNNNIRNLSVSNLASLCKLKRLDIDVKQLFRKENESCACHAVIEWITEFQIAMDNFSCPNKVCSVDLTQYRSQREDCNRRSFLKNIPIVYIVIAILLALPVALFLIELIRCCNRKKARKNTRLTQKVDDLRYA